MVTMSLRGHRVCVPEGVAGSWSVQKYRVSAADKRFQKLRMHINPGRSRRYVPEGEYTKLTHHGEVVMSDTPDELSDMREFTSRAYGDVFIAGLGLGVALSVILTKPEVKSVDIMEISEEVIRLVGPTYTTDPRVHLYQGDVLKITKFLSPKRWDIGWIDIWDTICADDTSEVRLAKIRYSKRINDWLGAWGDGERTELKRTQARNRLSW